MNVQWNVSWALAGDKQTAIVEVRLDLDGGSRQVSAFMLRGPDELRKFLAQGQEVLDAMGRIELVKPGDLPPPRLS